MKGITETEVREALTTFEPLWDELFPAEQARIVEQLVERVHAQDRNVLSDREREILALIQRGHLSKEISAMLCISVHTVNTHRQRFLEKLGANNSLEAIMFASKFGLLD